ncbi:MAG TPA: AAA family ATPase [Thiobacillus sp.]
MALPTAEHSLPEASERSVSGKPSGATTPSLSYLAHFGLNEAPFGLTPDTDFFYASPPHQEALNTLLYALESGEGFIKVVGAVGTGKTLLCRTLLSRLPAHIHAVYLPNPALDPAGMLFAVAEELGFKLSGKEGIFRVHKAIQLRLLYLAKRNIHVVMVVDEAQAISLDSLESVRLLSNLETEKRKLLTIILFGQPELDDQLESIPQLKTRISFHDRLRPLNRDELPAYLAHRLTRAGYHRANPLFTPRAIARLYQASAGVPRVVNVIAHKALMLAYGRGLLHVDLREIKTAASDTLAARSGARAKKWVAIGLMVSAVVAAGSGLYFWFGNEFFG